MSDRFLPDAYNIAAHMERKAALKFGADHGEDWPSYKAVDDAKIEVRLDRSFRWFLRGARISRGEAVCLIAARMEARLK